MTSQFQTFHPGLYNPFAAKAALSKVEGAHLHGADDDERMTPCTDPPIRHRGSTDLWKLRGDEADYTSYHLTKNYFRQPTRYVLDRYDFALNVVTDADLNAEVLEAMVRLLKPYRGRIINHPAAVLQSTRDKVSRRLQGLEAVVSPATVKLATVSPAAVRSIIEKGRLSFPAILRLAGTHTGKVLGIFDSAEAVTEQLERHKKYYLTSFVDCQSPDRLYRKYRFFFLGDAIVMRHLLVSDHWSVHAEATQRFMAPRPDLVAEERRAIEGGIDALPSISRDALLRIKERMNLDFFGLDCLISEAGIVTAFEANATMNFFPLASGDQFAFLRRCEVEARAAFRAMVLSGGRRYR